MKLVQTLRKTVPNSDSSALKAQVLALEAESDRLASMPMPSASSAEGDLQKASETFESLSYAWRRKNNAHRLSAAKAAYAEQVAAEGKKKDAVGILRESEEALPPKGRRRGSSFSRLANAAARFSPRRNRSNTGSKTEEFTPEKLYEDVDGESVSNEPGAREAARSDPEAASEPMGSTEARTKSASEVLVPSSALAAEAEAEPDTKKKKGKKKKKKGKGR
jgi:hypothetical protein